MRSTLLLSAFAFSLAGFGSPASATLLGQTVDPIFLLGSIGGSAGSENEGTQTVTAAGAHYGQNVQDGSTIDVSATRIIITDDLPPSQPFWSTANPCSDSFTGFDFKFSSGTKILSVTVDPASAASIRPNPGGSPAGLTLTSANEFTINLAGDAPSKGDQLILDLGFQPTSTPEPVSWALMLVGFGVVGAAARGRRLRRA